MGALALGGGGGVGVGAGLEVSCDGESTPLPLCSSPQRQGETPPPPPPRRGAFVAASTTTLKAQSGSAGRLSRQAAQQLGTASAAAPLPEFAPEKQDSTQNE